MNMMPKEQLPLSESRLPVGGPSNGPNNTDARDNAPVPPKVWNFQAAESVIELFNQATQANLHCPMRKGSTTYLPDRGTLVMTGDLHDHVVNLQRILRLSALDASPDRHVILHEVIHGERMIEGRDLSIRMLARVAALKVQYPGQVHLLLGNHELAQLFNSDILKSGQSVVRLFEDGMDYIYADQADTVREAMRGFIRSMLLAVKCANGLFCSHSLPSPRQFAAFDPAVIDRLPTDEDFAGPVGSAYAMVWGRNHTQEIADDLADEWRTRLFIMGHQPAEMGYHIEGENMIVLASDHRHGVAMPLDLSRPYQTIDDLVGELVPLASVPLE